MAGYSQTPLAKKLGIKEGFIIRYVNAPAYYFKLFSHLPQDITVSDDKSIKKNFIHVFVQNAKELESIIPKVKNEIEENGMIWISWYKKASKITTDVTEDLVRKIALQNGLVDVKVCAIDDVWSALKLVIPVKNRNSK
ncbi:MAG TPA: hypothetical protein VEV83_08955 [Parafilimonas sp.]|nr:hypothetical protein [Parafilimonas sp.]